MDATQGVQAQTVANFYLAFSQGLKLMPVVNKIDMASANVERALQQMQETLEIDPQNALKVSGQ